MNGADRDPEPTRTDGSAEQLRQALAELLVSHGQPSSREIARRLDGRLSHTTINNVLRCHGRVSLKSLRLVVGALAGENDRFRLDDLWYAHNGGRPSDGPAPIGGPVGVRIFSAAWMPYLLQNKSVSDQLLRGHSANEVQPALAPVEDFVREKPGGIAAEVQTKFGNQLYRVHSVPHLWAVMLVDSVLAHPDMSQNWLVGETEKILKQSEKALRQATTGPKTVEKVVGQAREQVDAVWSWLFATYLRRGGPGQALAPNLPDQLLRSALDVSGNDANRLFRIFEFLRQIGSDDPSFMDQIVAVLSAHEAELPEDVPEPTRSKVRTLIWRASSAGTGAQTPTGTFMPKVVDVSAATSAGRRYPLSYPFEAMRHPLTVSDVAAILLTPPEPNVMPGTPKVFTVRRPGMTDERVFAELTKQLTDIVTRCQAGNEDDWCWAVPTAAEWLVLAGCLDSPYPWGDAPPTRARANLNFPPEEPRLKEIGLHPRGRSPFKAHDCCGGVHEIVLIGPEQQMPADYRLAGASYKSPEQNADCRKLRPLTSDGKHSLSRQNLGLRLIRHRREDASARWEDLQRFLDGRRPV
jgi:hypothetical protein